MDDIDREAKARGVSREALIAFYRQQSEALRRNTTTTAQGAQAAPKRPVLQQPQQPARSGILGYVADRVTGALSGL